MLKQLSPKSLVSLDYETELNGEGSVEFWRPEFRVISAAVAFEKDGTIEVEYFEGEEKILGCLQILSESQNSIVVHNLAFEYGVTKHRFPSVSLNFKYDTMRLTQVFDNGGEIPDEDDENADDVSIGLSLSAAISRIIPEYSGHKQKAYDYLIQTKGVSPRDVGKSLNLLPPELLYEYNTKDAETTLRLGMALLKNFKEINYDFEFDHFLYREMVKLISNCRSEGVAVDKTFLENSVKSFTADYDKTIYDFNRMFEKEIAFIEEKNREKILGVYKTEKGKLSKQTEFDNNPELYKFNLNSTIQKNQLFVELLGIEPKFFTKKGAPSFAKNVLSQWGEGGKLLKQRGSNLIAKVQCEKLISYSETDGRWHIDINPAGTTTGRMKGQGGLNVQGMARKEPRLMKGIVADPGKVFVSVDLAAGEPSITAHFSKDPYYKSAILDMSDRKPFYDASGVLNIDDIYLMGMSVSPMGREKLHFLFENEKFNGLSFAEAWLKDPESIKKGTLAKDRAFHKILILGIGYSMGPKKMVLAAFNADYSLAFKDAKLFFKNYWKLFSRVRAFADKLESLYVKQGYLVNPFGYRLVPDKSYKAFNYFIQSSVSGLISVLCVKFFSTCPLAEFVTVIHDEIIFQIPENKEEECRKLFQQALDSLNEDLKWDISIKTGWKTGKNLYDAK